MIQHATREMAQELAEAGMPQGETREQWHGDAQTDWFLAPRSKQKTHPWKTLDAPSIGEYIQGLERAGHAPTIQRLCLDFSYVVVTQEADLLGVPPDKFTAPELLDALHAAWLELKPWEGWE